MAYKNSKNKQENELWHTVFDSVRSPSNDTGFNGNSMALGTRDNNGIQTNLPVIGDTTTGQGEPGFDINNPYNSDRDDWPDWMPGSANFSIVETWKANGNTTKDPSHQTDFENYTFNESLLFDYVYPKLCYGFQGDAFNRSPGDLMSIRGYPTPYLSGTSVSVNWVSNETNLGSYTSGKGISPGTGSATGGSYRVLAAIKLVYPIALPYDTIYRVRWSLSQWVDGAEVTGGPSYTPYLASLGYDIDVLIPKTQRTPTHYREHGATDWIEMGTYAGQSSSSTYDRFVNNGPFDRGDIPAGFVPQELYNRTVMDTSLLASNKDVSYAGEVAGQTGPNFNDPSPNNWIDSAKNSNGVQGTMKGWGSGPLNRADVNIDVIITPITGQDLSAPSPINDPDAVLGTVFRESSFLARQDYMRQLPPVNISAPGRGEAVNKAYAPTSAGPGSGSYDHVTVGGQSYTFAGAANTAGSTTEELKDNWDWTSIPIFQNPAGSTEWQSAQGFINGGNFPYYSEGINDLRASGASEIECVLVVSVFKIISENSIVVVRDVFGDYWLEKRFGPSTPFYELSGSSFNYPRQTTRQSGTVGVKCYASGYGSNLVPYGALGDPLNLGGGGTVQTVNNMTDQRMIAVYRWSSPMSGSGVDAVKRYIDSVPMIDSYTFQP